MKIYISLSSAVDKYLPMFKSLPNYESEKEYLERTIKYIVKILKKNDKITWLCKGLKIKMMSDAKLDNATIVKEQKRLKVCDWFLLPHSYNRTVTDLEHYCSLELPAMEPYVFGDKDWVTIKEDLEEIETKWQKSRERHVPEYGTKIITFPNGSAWFDLEKEWCKIEGDAMGHCGNSAKPKPGDTVLSYRVPVKGSDEWNPLLTFVLRKDGFLGEMKGRSNDKPLEKFHPYIIKLLLDKRVKGIRGDGYLPENNFKLFDLNTSLCKELLQKKPELGSFVEYIELSQNSKDPFYESELISLLESHNKTVRGTGNKIEILCGSFVEPHDFAEFFGLEKLEHYTQEDLFFDYDVRYDKSIAESLLNELSLKHKPTFDLLAAHYDTTIIRELSSEIDDEDDSIKDCFTCAMESGMLVGAHDDCYDEIQKTLANNGLEWLTENYSFWRSLSDVKDVLVKGRDEREIDCEDWLHSNESFVEWYKDEAYDYEDELKEGLEIEDLSEPYYGFDGYNEEAALERLVEELNDINIGE